MVGWFKLGFSGRAAEEHFTKMMLKKFCSFGETAKFLSAAEIFPEAGATLLLNIARE